MCRTVTYHFTPPQVHPVHPFLGHILAAPFAGPQWVGLYPLDQKVSSNLIWAMWESWNSLLRDVLLTPGSPRAARDGDSCWSSRNRQVCKDLAMDPEHQQKWRALGEEQTLCRVRPKEEQRGKQGGRKVKVRAKKPNSEPRRSSGELLVCAKWLLS